MKVQQSLLNQLLMRLVMIIPWAFIGWLIVKAFAGELDWLLAVVLVVIMAPIAVVLNIATIIVFNGRAVLKQFKNVQNRAQSKNEPLTSTNYSDLQWWNPRKYL